MRFDLAAMLAWFKQPSTVTGLSALAAVAAGLLAGQMTAAAAIPAVVFGVVAILLPDNSRAWQDARLLAQDALAARQAPDPAMALPPVLHDVAALGADLRSAAPVAAKH